MPLNGRATQEDPFVRSSLDERATDEGDRFPPMDELGRPPDAERRRAFPIMQIDELEISDAPTMLIEDVLPASGFGIVFGPPKSLKSFLLADALFHVAMGRTWAGRDVLQGAVVYVTAEGVEGFKRRLIAMRRHYGVEGAGVPFLLIPVAPDLGHASGEDAVLIETVRARLADLGNPPVRAVAIDTLARTMKGADENTAKDMTVFVDNCERIGSALGCLVVGVHHAGKDIAKGSRGSNALDGAVDVMWSVEKGEAACTATIHYMKDGEAGASWQFRLQPMTLREAGARVQAVTSAVVELLSEPGAPTSGASESNGKRLSDRTQLLLGIIQHVTAEIGMHVHGNPNVPPEVLAIPREKLKAYLPLKGYWDEDLPDNRNRAFLSNDIKTLAVRKKLGVTKGLIWLL